MARASELDGLTVYGRASSSNVQAVMWGAAELGLNVQRVDVGGRFGGLDAPEFRAMNPNGLIPVLQTKGGAAIFESGAILRYLASICGDDSVWPRDPLARAAVDAWAEWGKRSFGEAFTGPIFWRHWRTPEAERDTRLITQNIHVFEQQMAIVAPRIAADGWVAGAHLTLADIWVGHVLFRYFTLDITRNPPPVFAEYYARLCQRDAYRTHVMRDYADLKATFE